MGELVIRDCETDDVAAVTAIYGHYVRSSVATFEEEPPCVGMMESRRQALLENNYPYIVAELGNTVVGYGYVTAYRPRPAYRFTVENSIYMDSTQRGLGFGRMLLDELILQCSLRDFRQMIAVIADRSAASIALHAAAGFREVGQLDDVGFKFGRSIGTTFMQRPLGSGP